MTVEIDILNKLESGSLILTANKRLSRYLESQYEARQLSDGRSAWLAPKILPFDSWCHQQYDLLADALTVISRAQGNLVWEKIIEESIRDTGHELLQVAPTAEMAWKAEQLLVRYHASFNNAEATDDQLMFLQWQAAWKSQLDSLGMVDAATLPRFLAEKIDTLKPDLPVEIVFAGFDDIDPSIEYLQGQMEGAGCRIVNYQPRFYTESHKERLCCSDRRDEIQDCALSVKQLIEKNPEYRIGVVAPNLKLYREQIEHIFRAELDPQGLMFINDEPPCFNMSEAPALAEEPVVHAALRLLRLGNLIELEDLGALLRSPYLAQAESAEFKRAACDRELRRLRRSRFRVSSLDGLLKRLKCDQGFIDLSSQIARFVRLPDSALPGEWAERFSNFLDTAGWPGERALSSHEFQAVDRFRRLLNEFTSLDRVATRIRRLDAVSRLSRLANDIEFQPEGATSGINVVGMLEASGMQFDFLWILGMHSGALPSRPQPNPFIPPRLQQRLQMPHASADRELAYAENVTSRLFSSAPTVVASWPAMEEGMPVMMNHFIRNFPDREKTCEPSSDPTLLIHKAGLPLETLHDSNAPPVSSRKTVSGGTSIIKDQAICPFRAFAHHRLRAEAFDEADLGIDVLTRGSLAHKVLELFWEEVRTLNNLQKLTEAGLRQKIHSAAESAVNNNRWKLPDGQREIEIERLARLTFKWLDVEKQRPEFGVVSIEKEHTEKIGRLQIKTIIDRIDRLENGQLAIIDYKTGQPDPAQWFDDRVTEPQMPIYCQQISSESIDAVAFAVVRPGRKECKFKGIARNSESWPGISEKSQQELMAGRQWGSFDHILENWRVALPKLGNSFMDGEAKVNPYDREKACRYCDLMPLCRLHESETWGREGGDD